MSLEPRITSKVYSSTEWPTIQLLQVVDNEVRLPNLSKTPIYLPKNDHLCQVRATYTITDSTKIKNLSSSGSQKSKTPPEFLPPFSNKVLIDPNKQLDAEWVIRFEKLNLEYDGVFEPTIGRYNDKSGKL